MKKILFAGATVLLIAAGCNSQTASNNNVYGNPGTTTSTNQSSTSSSSVQSNSSASTSDNASLNSSLNQIDGQMNSLNTDSANVDSSANPQ